MPHESLREDTRKSMGDRALRERLRRRMHLVRMRASVMNPIFGLQTQWGLCISLQRLRAADAITLLEQRGVPVVWRAPGSTHEGAA